jgi:hypothetical protein
MWKRGRDMFLIALVFMTSWRPLALMEKRESSWVDGGTAEEGGKRERKGKRNKSKESKGKRDGAWNVKGRLIQASRGETKSTGRKEGRWKGGR